MQQQPHPHSFEKALEILLAPYLEKVYILVYKKGKKAKEKWITGLKKLDMSDFSTALAGLHVSRAYKGRNIRRSLNEQQGQKGGKKA